MQIKEEARTNTESTQRVLSKVLADADTDCSSKLPSIDSMKRKIRRIRQEERDCPAIPHNTDFDIPSKFMLTQKSEDFLLEDGTITQSGKRYLMFATN